MTEDEARAWIAAQFGDLAIDRLERFVRLIDVEASRQNLISAGSREAIWNRHIVDSAQLLGMASGAGLWIDIGTGAGFPGIVTALLSDRNTLLVEPRRRRVEFLQHAIDMLGITSRVEVKQSRIEIVSMTAAIISARAVASIDNLLSSAQHCSDRNTQWLLPKGRKAIEEVAEAKQSWHGVFHVEQSITDPASMIVVANKVVRR